MKFDISGLLVKHDSKIDTNKSNITENLKLINSKSDIIETNKNNIPENLELINTKSDIIEDNKNNITNNYNISQINKKKSEFNTTLIDNNKNNITNNYNITQINKKISEFNTTLIDNNKNNINSIKNDIVKTNISEDVHINSPKFSFIQSSLNNNFKKDSYLEFDSSILIFFNKHHINIGIFHILLEYLYSENELFKELKLPLASGSIAKFCNVTNSCIIKLPDNFNKIFFKLSIKLNDRQNRTDSISILDFDNKIYFKYFENSLDYNI